MCPQVLQMAALHSGCVPHTPVSNTHAERGCYMLWLKLSAVHTPKLGHQDMNSASGTHRFPVVEGPADDVLLEEGNLADELVQLPLPDPTQHGGQLCSLSLCMERNPCGRDCVVRPSCRRPGQDAELVRRVRVLGGCPADAWELGLTHCTGLQAVLVVVVMAVLCCMACLCPVRSPCERYWTGSWRRTLYRRRCWAPAVLHVHTG